MSGQSNRGRSRLEYFQLACQRNAMRKSKGLPLLEVKDEMHRLELNDYRNLYRDIAEKYAPVRDRLYLSVLRELRRERADLGYGKMGPARMYVSIKTMKLFREYLTSKGYPPPSSKSIDDLRSKDTNKSDVSKPFDANITYIVDEVVKTLGHSQQMQVDNEPLI
jgi:hypothetical protein